MEHLIIRAVSHCSVIRPLCCVIRPKPQGEEHGKRLPKGKHFCFTCFLHNSIGTSLCRNGNNDLLTQKY